MNDSSSRSFEKRISNLEVEVAELRRRLLPQANQPEHSRLPEPALLPEPVRLPYSELPEKKIPTGPNVPVDASADFRRGEFWLNKIGIGLLLFGVAFLFKYSIDRGWLTPSVRVGFGLLVGAVLVAVGFRIFRTRGHFAQVLTGGGIAAFHITAFAAYQLYSLVHYDAAFAFMGLVNLFAYFVSINRRARVMAILGTVGGLATPFILYTPSGSIPGLVTYTCILLSVSLGIYYRTHCVSLLRVVVVGGWLVMAAAAVTGSGSIDNDWWLQSGFFFCWLAFQGFPQASDFRFRKAVSGKSATGVDSHLLTIISPFITLGASQFIWRLELESLGWFVLIGAALYAAISVIFSQRGNVISAWTHLITALALLTVSLCLLLHGNTLLLALASEATVLQLANRRMRSLLLESAGHFLFLVCGFALLQRLIGGQVSVTPVFNPRALTDTAVIGLAVVSAFALKAREIRLTYLVLLHLLFLLWLYREFHWLTHGSACVSIAWGSYSAVMLVAGLRLNSLSARLTALATLFLTAGKLLLVDLSRLDPLWRILLFSGFGGVFLALSYFFQALWRAGKRTVA